jgi:hypothetical protein
MQELNDLAERKSFGRLLIECRNALARRGFGGDNVVKA